MNEKLVSFCVSTIQSRDPLSEEYEVTCIALAHLLTPTYTAQLSQLVENGPIWDGDCVAKIAKAAFIRWGLAVTVIVAGKTGYTAATMRGHDVYQHKKAPRLIEPTG